MFSLLRREREKERERERERAGGWGGEENMKRERGVDWEITEYIWLE